MLLSSLVSALALNACFVRGALHPSSFGNLPHTFGARGSIGASFSTQFDSSVGTIDRYQPTFTQACQQKKPDVLIKGLGDIKASISVLGSADGLAQVDVNTLTTKVLNLMVKLQVVLKVIDQYKMTSSCSSAIVDLKGSLQIMISAVASQNTDITTQCKSAGVDLDFYARVGIKLDLGAQVAAVAGAGAGAGVNVDASTKVVADLQAAISVTADIAPKFKSACEQKNVDVVVSSLATIRTSILSLGTNVNAFAKADANVLSSNVVSLFVKLQVLLRLISDNNLSSSCQSAIVSLKAPLQAVTSVVASVGVDVSAKLSSAVDVTLFTKVGLDIGLTTNIASGVGAGTGVGSGVGAGTGVGSAVGAGAVSGAGTGVGAGTGGTVGSGSGAGAGVNVDASTKVVADLQAAVSVTADIAPKFKSACEQKNVDVVVSSLATIRTSILSLGTNVNAFAKVDANVISTNVLSLFVKLQVLMRLISDNNLSASCQSAIVSLQAPLKTIVASAGVDVSAKISSTIDVSLFTKVGLDVGISSNAAAGVSSGSGGVGTGTGTDGTVAAGSGVQADTSGKVVTNLQASVSLMAELEPKFKTACANKNTDVLVSGLGNIKTSITSLGTSANVYAKVDANILTTNVLGLFVKLQVLLRLISDSKMGPSCQDAIASLQAPLKAVLAVVASVGVDISTKISAAVDVSLFTQIGLDIGVNGGVGAGAATGANANAGAGVATGAAANANAGAGVATGAGAATGAGTSAGADTSAKVLADFKASTNTAVTLAPTFKTACEQKNVAVLNQGLVSIVGSIASVGAQANVLAHVSADDLCTQFFDLLIKIQILLKIIDQYSLASSCKGSIVSLNAPLKVLLSVLVSVGVDVSAKAKAYTSLDLSFFAKVGVTLNIQASASVNSSH